MYVCVCVCVSMCVYLATSFAISSFCSYLECMDVCVYVWSMLCMYHVCMSIHCWNVCMYVCMFGGISACMYEYVIIIFYRPDFVLRSPLPYLYFACMWNICMYVWVCAHILMRATTKYWFINVHACTRVYMHTCIHTHVCTYTCVCIHRGLWNVCTYAIFSQTHIYIHPHTHTHIYYTHTHADIWTYTHMHRSTHACAYKYLVVSPWNVFTYVCIYV